MLFRSLGKKIFKKDQFFSLFTIVKDSYAQLSTLFTFGISSSLHSSAFSALPIFLNIKDLDIGVGFSLFKIYWVGLSCT